MSTYLIIGGSSGIGFDIATKLAIGEHKVIAMSRKRRDLEEYKAIEFHEIDVTADSSTFPDIEEPLDGIVYGAGTINLKPFKALKIEDFQLDYEINLLGAVKVLQKYHKLLKEGASVVLFSTVAVQLGLQFHASISSAKGAVEGLIRSLAAEWAPKIRVNGVAPSVTDTPLAQKLLNSEQKQDAARQRHALNRYGKPEDIAEAALFLLSEKSSWMTGDILHVDGGMGTVRPL